MSTDVFVETIYDTIIVDDSSDTLLIETPGPTTIITIGEQGPAGPSGIENLNQLLDVDSSNKVQGSILVYSTQNQKWVATTLLENQNVESGQY